MNPPIDIHDPANHTLEGFRAFYSAIDDSRWTVGVGLPTTNTGCALSLLWQLGARVDPTDIRVCSLVTALAALFAPLLGSHKSDFHLIADINDGKHPGYVQFTPRARILAAIDDLIARKVPSLP